MASLKPQDKLIERRRLAANGREEKQVVDTIGKVWAQGLLASPKFRSEQLRDAGRRYATLYWHRYGACCASTAHYGEFVAKSSSNVIDIGRERRLETLLEKRQRALGAYSTPVRQTVDMFCVDGQGDCDPNWLAELCAGLPSYARQERQRFDELSRQWDRAAAPDKRRLERLMNRQLSCIKEALAESRLAIIPALRIDWLNYGLECLAEIDASEGRHRRGRRRGG